MLYQEWGHQTGKKDGHRSIGNGIRIEGHGHPQQERPLKGAMARDEPSARRAEKTEHEKRISPREGGGIHLGRLDKKQE